jgi:aquaporin Z
MPPEPADKISAARFQIDSKSFRKHWPEYLIEAACLGVFMISANLFAGLLGYPASPAQISNDFFRRLCGGLAMGVTAICLIYSPWGQRSGAHMNPALTLTYFRLGKIQPADALFYIAAQFLGGFAGVMVSKFFLGKLIWDPSVNHVVTTPGPAGPLVAFVAELLISCGMMLMVLVVSNNRRLSRLTGLFAGVLVALYITFESPLSGMSMNPARTTASALPSGIWTSAWIYFTAPVAGMLLAAEIYSRFKTAIACPKYFHGTRQRCIFCGYPGAGIGHRATTTRSRPAREGRSDSQAS